MYSGELIDQLFKFIKLPRFAFIQQLPDPHKRYVLTAAVAVRHVFIKSRRLMELFPIVCPSGIFISEEILEVNRKSLDHKNEIPTVRSAVVFSVSKIYGSFHQAFLEQMV